MTNLQQTVNNSIWIINISPNKLIFNSNIKKGFFKKSLADNLLV